MITSKRNSVSATMSEQEKRVEAETRQLLVDIQRIKPEGESYCLFGDLFVDPAVEQYYEALVGTLKAAKKKGLIQFDGQILFKGMHDHVQVSIVKNGNKPANSGATPTRRNSHVPPTMTTSSSQQQTVVISPTAKSSCMESSSSKSNNALLLTPTKKDSFTQTSTSSTKKTILTPSHLRNQMMMKKNIHIDRDRKPLLVKSNGEYKKKGFQIYKEEKVNDDLSCCNTVDSGNVPRTIPVNRSVSIALNEGLDRVAEGDLKNKIAETHKERVDREIRQLLLDIKRIEPKEEQFCSFGDLFVDEHVEQYYEALVGTLKAAKRKGLIHFQGQMLFKGLHDHVQIKIVE